MVAKIALVAAVAAAFWSPAVSDELKPKYKVTVLQRLHREITVEADEERAARTIALLEARRMSRLSPTWSPSPPSVLAHRLEADDVDVIEVERLPLPATAELSPP